VQLDLDVATHISITRDGRRSLLSVETADRPGLLLEILKVICDISIYVESAEIDTEGLVAKDKFYVTYHGDHLSPSMEEVLTNALRYYLRRPDTEEDSY
jgi:UTP:GlnB (protein PII) uridylyltransferase